MDNQNGDEKQDKQSLVLSSDETEDRKELSKILTECGYLVEEIFSASQTPEVVSHGKYAVGYDHIILAFVPGGQREAKRILRKLI